MRRSGMELALRAVEGGVGVLGGWFRDLGTVLLGAKNVGLTGSTCVVEMGVVKELVGDFAEGYGRGTMALHNGAGAPARGLFLHLPGSRIARRWDCGEVDRSRILNVHRSVLVVRKTGVAGVAVPRLGI